MPTLTSRASFLLLTTLCQRWSASLLKSFTERQRNEASSGVWIMKWDGGWTRCMIAQGHLGPRRHSEMGLGIVRVSRLMPRQTRSVCGIPNGKKTEGRRITCLTAHRRVKRKEKQRGRKAGTYVHPSTCLLLLLIRLCVSCFLDPLKS